MDAWGPRGSLRKRWYRDGPLEGRHSAFPTRRTGASSGGANGASALARAREGTMPSLQRFVLARVRVEFGGHVDDESAGIGLGIGRTFGGKAFCLPYAPNRRVFRGNPTRQARWRALGKAECLPSRGASLPECAWNSEDTWMSKAAGIGLGNGRTFGGKAFCLPYAPNRRVFRGSQRGKRAGAP